MIRISVFVHETADVSKDAKIGAGTKIWNQAQVRETAVIGKNVRVYQNVTIGALSLPPDAGEKLRGARRHPTIEDDVIIYSGATILGGEVTIGARSVVGGNVWLTSSIPSDTKVFMESPKLIYKYEEGNGGIL